MPNYGNMTVEITTLSKKKMVSLVVTRTPDTPVVLGMPFIKQFGIMIDGKNGTISSSDDNFLQLYFAAKQKVPANHFAKIMARPLDAKTNIRSGDLVEVHRTKLDNGCTIEGGVYKVQKYGIITLLVSNHSPMDIWIHKNRLATTMEIISEEELIQTAKIIATFSKITSPNLSDQNKIPNISEEKKKDLASSWHIGAPISHKHKYENLILKYHDIFSNHKFDLGFSDLVSHKVEMTSDQPIFRKQYRIPHSHQEAIEKHVRELLACGIIEQCSSPYNTPIFCVEKKDKSLRIVQDFREINKFSKEDKFMIKDVRECLDTVGKAKSNVFSTMDLASGFWQQNLEVNSRDLTAFTIPSLNEQFRWTRSVMGLQGAPASFNRLMARILQGLKNVTGYLDDILAHSKGHEHHLLILECLFNRLRETNMKLSIQKCHFGTAEVTYLGYRVSEQGMAPARDKVKAVEKVAPPRKLKQVRAFLGFCNYFRTMIPRFTMKAQGLVNLTKKNTSWKDEQPLPQEAIKSFNDLKEALMSAPVIAFPTPNQPFILTTDASAGSDDTDGGLAAVLTQEQDGQEKVIAYWSRTLKHHEKNYTPYMVEMAAVCEALDYFHEYVWGNKIKVRTDHRPLVGASKIQKKTINRLAEKMNLYDLEVEYLKGSANVAADFLSRYQENHISVIHESGNDLNLVLETIQQDDEIKAIMKAITSKRLDFKNEKIRRFAIRFAPRCMVQKGALWIWNDEKWKLWLPKPLRNEALIRAHGSPLAGHWAADKTYDRLRNKLFWPGMWKDTEHFTQNCVPCSKQKKPMAPQPLQEWPQPTKPNERVHIDLYGPLQGDDNHKYIMVMTCAFSKWVELTPITNKTAEVVAKALFDEWICRHGPMTILVHDGGKEFKNNLMSKIMELMDTKDHTITPRHPMANGQVERFNREMRKYLATMLDGKTKEWKEMLKPLQFAYNTMVHDSTGFTPYYIMHTRNPRLPETFFIEENEQFAETEKIKNVGIQAKFNSTAKFFKKMSEENVKQAEKNGLMQAQDFNHAKDGQNNNDIMKKQFAEQTERDGLMQAHDIIHAKKGQDSGKNRILSKASIQEREKQAEAALRTVQERQQAATERNKLQFNKKAELHSFKIGDLVLLSTTPKPDILNKKLLQPFTESFSIVKFLSDNTVLIKGWNNKTSKCHVNHLRPMSMNATQTQIQSPCQPLNCPIQTQEAIQTQETQMTQETPTETSWDEKKRRHFTQIIPSSLEESETCSWAGTNAQCSQETTTQLQKGLPTLMDRLESNTRPAKDNGLKENFLFTKEFGHHTITTGSQGTWKRSETTPTMESSWHKDNCQIQKEEDRKRPGSLSGRTGMTNKTKEGHREDSLKDNKPKMNKEMEDRPYRNSWHQEPYDQEKSRLAQGEESYSEHDETTSTSSHFNAGKTNKDKETKEDTSYSYDKTDFLEEMILDELVMSSEQTTPQRHRRTMPQQQEQDLEQQDQLDNMDDGQDNNVQEEDRGAHGSSSHNSGHNFGFGHSTRRLRSHGSVPEEPWVLEQPLEYRRTSQ